MFESQAHPLTDSFQRCVNYLRISVTDRCNLRCRYCAPAMPTPKPMKQLLTLDEMHRLVCIGADLGITKVRLTGGEPLCRSGIDRFIKKLFQIPQIKDVSLTTNGTLLLRDIETLQKAGLRRLNISLDTLNRTKFQQLTGYEYFDQVWQGIQGAAVAGFQPIKINVVVMKGFNDDEIARMARLTFRFPFHIRFIEYMPIGTDPVEAQRYFFPIAAIKERLCKISQLISVDEAFPSGPAQRYRFKGARGEIGLIGSMSAHFCHTCNRLRLTANGYLRPCLLAEDQINVIQPMRRGAGDHELKSLFIRTINCKKAEHQMNFSGNQRLQTQMVSIGG